MSVDHVTKHLQNSYAEPLGDVLETLWESAPLALWRANPPQCNWHSAVKGGFGRLYFVSAFIDTFATSDATRLTENCRLR